MTATTVWELATTTGQPLEVVIFQSVAYGAWNGGGRLDSEWTATLTAVLSGSHPWKRVVTNRPGSNDGAGTQDPKAVGVEMPDQLASDGTEGSHVVSFIAAVLANLGHPIPVDDATLAERLAAAGLGEVSVEGFTGYAEEAPTWQQLSHGTLKLDELAS